MLRVLIGCLLVIIGCAVTAQAESVRIGLFNLLKPQRLEIQADKKIDITLLDHHYQLMPGDRLIITQANTPANIKASSTISSKASTKNSLLNCRIEGIAAQSWQTNNLQLTGEGLIEIEIPGKLTRRVPAALALNSGNGMIRSIVTMDLEVAVKMVTAAELNEIGALTGKQMVELYKALTIAVRSYIHYGLGRHRAEGFDCCDNTHCLLYYGQELLDGNGPAPAIVDAANATAGEMLYYQGKVVPGFFTAACGGMTALPSESWQGDLTPQLASYRRVKCDYCQSDRFFRWQRKVDRHRLGVALQKLLPFRAGEEWELRIGRHTKEGFVLSMEASQQGRHIEIAIDKFRHAIGTKLGWNLVLSNAFEVTPQGGDMLFKGRGFGHNLGLCMAGAVTQARTGRDGYEILRYYYPSLKVSRTQ